MNVIQIPRRPSATARRHTPLVVIDRVAAARRAGRVADIPGRQPVRPITFNSAP